MASPRTWETSNYSPEVKAVMANHGSITRKQLLWIDLYFGEGGMNATQAARLAGYKFPTVDGPKLARKFDDVLAAIFNEMSVQRRMEANEVIEGISNLARGAESEANKLKALELLAKIHGLLNERLSISVDRRTLIRQIEGIIKQKQGLAEAKAVLGKRLPPGKSLDIPAVGEDVKRGGE